MRRVLNDAELIEWRDKLWKAIEDEMHIYGSSDLSSELEGMSDEGRGKVAIAAFRVVREFLCATTTADA